MTGFESIDLWYETPLGRLYFKRIKEKLDELINTREERFYALDAGCGAGHYSLNLARSYKVIGVDKSQVLVSKALEKSDKLGTGVNFLVADIFSLPFPSNFFKLIICLNVIEFVPGSAKAVKELKRVLAPGGVLVLGVCNKKSLWGLLKGIGKPFRKSDPFFGGTFYSKDDLLSLARQTGLELDKTEGAIYFPPIKNAVLAILYEKVGKKFLKDFPGCLIASMRKSEDVKSI